MNAHTSATRSLALPGPAPGCEYYRADIDGLRAIAVLAVVGFHAFPAYFPGGFVGVDVFFVISGFLITSIILRQLRSSTFTLAQFYARRIRRIFPTLTIVLMASLACGWLVLLPDELEHLGKHVAAAAAFVSNVVLWQEGGYFDRAAELKPLLHLWSLGVEEQFYLVWPMLLLLLWRRQQNIAATIMLLTVASFVLSIVLGHEKRNAGFYLPLSRFWELGLGGLLAIAKQSPAATGQWLALRSGVHSLLPVIGIGLIAAAIFLFDRDTKFPGWAALVPTAGAMCLIGARADSYFQRRIMACTGLVLIGAISYPLYLWHWPLLSFATILESGTPRAFWRLTAVLLSVALAWLTCRFLERPIRMRRNRCLALPLAAGLSTFGAIGWVMYGAEGFAARFDVEVRSIRPGPKTNSLCVGQFPGPRKFNYCKSTNSVPPVAIFVGDSRAQGVYDGAVALLGMTYPLTLLGLGGCPAMLHVPFDDSNDTDCNDAWRGFVKYIGDVKPAVVVVVGGGSSFLQRPTATSKLQQSGESQFREREFKRGLKALFAALQKTSRVIYVRELPRFDSAPACFLRPVRLPSSQCSPQVVRKAVEEAMASDNRVVDEIQRELPELRIVDSIATVCGENVCSQRLPSGEIIYSDAIHLSPAGGRYFARASGLPDMIDDMVDEVNAGR